MNVKFLTIFLLIGISALIPSAIASSERPDAYAEWDEASTFTTTGTAVTRVVDQYMNMDSYKVETLTVDIYTERNEDKPELKVTLTEINVDAGIFEGTISFSETEKSLGNTLQVKDGDIVSVEYTYSQVPGSDKLEDFIIVGQEKTIQSYSKPTITLDRTVYPVPFGGVNDFEDTESFFPDGRSIFPVHATAIVTGKIQKSETLSTGDLMLHIRINDSNFDVSENIDEINNDINDKTVGPMKISISRGLQTLVLGYAGGSTPDKNGLIDVDDDDPGNARHLGPISEVAPDAGIFELDLAVRYTDGPSNPRCPATAAFSSLDTNFKTGSEESRFDEPSTAKENYCIMNGDVLTVEYTYLDESGKIVVASDSATFELRNGTLEANDTVYTIGSDMILTLTDPDLDLDNDAAETYPLDLIEWDSDAATLTMGNLGGETTAFDPEPTAFRETGDSTGIFQIVVEIPESLEDDPLERGEEIILEYTDWSPSSAMYVGQEDEDVNWTLYTSNFGATVELDKKTYTWTDKVYITIIATDHNFNGDLIDEIGNTDHSSVKIATSKYDLDNYKLVETDINTGIFVGEVTLTGFSHDADGNESTGTQGNDVLSGDAAGKGPTDGMLPTSNVDGLTVQFEFSEDETVVGSALIQWNEGKVKWLEDSYPSTGTGVVRVIDPDMNWDPEEVDNFTIDVWSDSDAGGIDLTMTETNEATGIFEGTVFFSTTDESSGHRLRVYGEDTIHAEYEDNTLPEPYLTSDELDIIDTSMIQKIPPLSPYKQMMSGILTHDITCKDILVKIFRSNGFVACVDSSSVKKLLQKGWSLNLIPVDFAGEWKNSDSETNDIANITIAQSGSAVTAHVWSSCDPNTFCDWKESSGTVDGNSATFTWKVESVMHDVTITKIGNNLQVDRESVSSDPQWIQNKQMDFIPGTLTAGR